MKENYYMKTTFGISFAFGVALLIIAGGWFFLRDEFDEGNNGNVINDDQNGENVIRRDAPVTDIDIVLLESFPVQVRVTAKGQFDDVCTDLAEVKTRKEANTFFVTVASARFKDADCSQVSTPFEEHIPLDVYGLPQGIYTVNVNGITDTFEFTVDNTLQK